MSGSGGDTWLHMGTGCSQHWVSHRDKHNSCLWFRPGSHQTLEPLDATGPFLLAWAKHTGPSQQVRADEEPSIAGLLLREKSRLTLATLQMQCLAAGEDLPPGTH